MLPRLAAAAACRPRAPRAPSRALAANANKATFEVLGGYKLHRVTAKEGPETTVTATKDELMKFHQEMLLYRRIEIASDLLYKEKKIRGFCHLYDGQEAITAGMEAGMRPGDSIITAYRDHTTQLGRGDTPERVLGELLGKATGCSKGKGGSMHMYLRKNNFYGGNGIVGAQVPVGAGIGFAHKYRKDGGVCFAMYGDGAANQGQIYEAANMAALWKLPVVFLCENNEYGMGTSTKRAAANSEFYTRGDVIPGVQASGMDVLAVRAAVQWATSWCRQGKGPVFLELKTYRYHGHSMSDPGIAYRSSDEVSNVRQTRDCIKVLRERIIEKGWAKEEELDAVAEEVKKQIAAAEAAAKAAPVPDEKELYSDIYAGAPPPFIRMPDNEHSVRFA